MSNNDLPYPNPENFIGAFERMDLSELRDKQFLVSINSGDPSSPDFICRAVRGPYSLGEMAEEVGYMWTTHAHHAHVTVLNRKRDAKAQWLSPEVIDYIEQNYEDIVMDEFLISINETPNREYTCRAKILDSTSQPEPKEGSEDGMEQNSLASP